MRLIRALLLFTSSLLGLATLYLLTLLAAASLRRESVKSEVGGQTCSFVVLVPAHNEELDIEQTVVGLRSIAYPRDQFEVVVVADNCTDGTATLARGAGATVFVRSDPERRGKGYALSWALERLLAERPDMDAVAIVDADCSVSPNFLSATASRLADADAVQTNNVVGNADASWSSALSYAAFTLINTVRPLGKSCLGLSCGLMGTGMAFSRSLLERHPWGAFSLAEDNEYHFRLVAAGDRVAFAPEAYVSSHMPTSLGAARTQQLRWEGGRWDLIRRWTPPLLIQGLRQRNFLQIHVAIEPLIPPQALLLAGNAALALLALVTYSPAALRLSVLNLFGQVGYVLGGLLISGAPLSVYRALAFAPVLVLWKVGLWFKLVLGSGAREWTRTERSPHRGDPRRKWTPSSRERIA